MYLLECILHSARLLTSLSSNTEFSTKFVDQGGQQRLLRLDALRYFGDSLQIELDSCSIADCSSEKPADWHTYLSECIMHSARLLESLGSNTDFSTKFVDQGGLQLLLRLYTLRHLPPTFGSSSAAHALVAAVRILNQAAVSSVTSKVVEALTGQLRTTLLLGMVRHHFGEPQSNTAGARRC